VGAVFGMKKTRIVLSLNIHQGLGSMIRKSS